MIRLINEDGVAAKIVLPCYVVPFLSWPHTLECNVLWQDADVPRGLMCLPGFVKPVHHGQRLPVGRPLGILHGAPSISAVRSSHIAVILQAVDY